ncbi:MAG: hypothetical protein HC887_01655 [Desulfobacteraceae bacterium]|nr:hypothetical protein [Desulfobacteraceae bacterium]
MDISSKIAILNRIYGIYEKFCSDMTLACGRYCSQCCTCNVTLTSLEAYRIVRHLTETRQTDLLKKLNHQIQKPRFQPQITTNTFAAYCIEGREPPDEESDPAWGQCPFLTSNECPIYEARPFGCRCFVSRINCSESGTAEIDDFVITVNTVFQQYIEQLDIPGFFGNFSDMILNAASCQEKIGMAANARIPALMIPPEHRERIQGILKELRRFSLSEP